MSSHNSNHPSDGRQEPDGHQPDAHPSDDQSAENRINGPELFAGRAGTRLYSAAALVERVVTAFEIEHPPESEARQAAVTKSDRLRLLRDTLLYVVGVESVHLTPNQQADLTRRAYSEIFGFGPLDTLFENPDITTITLEGIEKVAVRYGHGELTRLEPVFEDYEQFQRVIRRLVQQAGAQINPEHPYLEVGLTIDSQPVCVNLVLPPASVFTNADIRVHLPALPELSGIVDSQAALDLLTAIARSPHGILIVGETESGKTTLLSVLAQLIPADGMVSVERAGELRLPETAQRRVVQWPTADHEGITFAQHIAQVTENSPDTPPATAPDVLLLDEVRADEPDAVLPLLTHPKPPRMLWVFRGQAEPKRLSAALGILTRRTGDEAETTLHALYHRLPLVIAVRRRAGQLIVSRIGEWQYSEPSAYPSLVELMAHDGETLMLTGRTPSVPLDLPADFWQQRP